MDKNKTYKPRMVLSSFHGDGKKPGWLLYILANHTIDNEYDPFSTEMK